MRLRPPYDAPLAAVAWDVEALRTLLVQMLDRCTLGSVDLMHAMVAQLVGEEREDKEVEGLNKEEFVAAMRKLFFASEPVLWEQEVRRCVEQSVDALWDVIKGENFTRRITVVHFERWLRGGERSSPVRQVVPFKTAPAPAEANPKAGRRPLTARQSPRPPGSAASLLRSPRLSSPRVLPRPMSGPPRAGDASPVGTNAASRPSALSPDLAKYRRLRARGMSRMRARIQTSKAGMQQRLEKRLHGQGVELTPEERQRFGNDAFALWTMMKTPQDSRRK